MNNETAFRKWYESEGVRTPVADKEGTTWHEQYQRLAFDAGFKIAMDHCISIIDEIEKRLKK